MITCLGVIDPITQHIPQFWAYIATEPDLNWVWIPTTNGIIVTYTCANLHMIAWHKHVQNFSSLI